VAYGFDGTNTYLLFNTDTDYAINNIANFEFGIRLAGQHAPDASWFNL
jgi:hypothetical protein